MTEFHDYYAVDYKGTSLIYERDHPTLFWYLRAVNNDTNLGRILMSDYPKCLTGSYFVACADRCRPLTPLEMLGLHA